MADDEEKENCIEAKGILVGEVGVGKTNLINVSIGKQFESTTKTTISSNFVKKYFEIDNEKYIINLWDTAGQEKLKSMTKLFFKGSDIVIYVYDITSENSFESLKQWVKETENLLENQHICGIVGNKKDLYLEEKVDEKKAKEFADSKGMKFKLVSAKDDPRSFIDFLEELLKECRSFISGREKNIFIKEKDGKKEKKNDCKC